tara:strand:+ start:331 stop:498 length:168 start_codon:yes stop_codon:yes gene_type:complete
MKELINTYNELAQQFEDWAFKYLLPPVFKLIEVSLKLTLFYAFYLLVKNAIGEAF